MTAFLMKGGNIEDLLLQWRRQYGPYFEFQVPLTPPVLIVADPEAIKEVFELRQYHKSPRYGDLLPLLGSQSMIITEGEVWRKQRDTFNPGFSSTFLQAALPGFVSCTAHMVQALERAAEEQKVVLMHELAILTTTEVICKVGFGEDLNLFERGISDPLWSSFRALGEHVAWFMDNIPFNWMKFLPWNRSKVARLQQQLEGHLLVILKKRLAQMGIPESSLERGPGSVGAARSSASCPVVYSAVHGAASGANGHNSSSSSTTTTGTASFSAGSRSSALTAAASSSNNTADEAARCPFHSSPAAHSSSSSSGAGGAPGIDNGGDNGGGGEGGAPSGGELDAAMREAKDILSLALTLSGSEGRLDREMLLSQMKTFFAAGHDTTASLVAWAVYCLCRNPEAERKLREEVDAVMKGAEAPTYQQLTEMKYMTMVLKETLRYRPPVGLLARWGPPGSSLASYDIGEKVLVVSPYIQHMDQDVWGPDAATWDPERWREDDGVAQNVGPYSFMPFSRGPRDCIGARFALLEAKTILAMLYSSFEFEYAGSGPESVMMSITAHPKYGVPVRVRRKGGVQRVEERVGESVRARSAV